MKTSRLCAAVAGTAALVLMSACSGPSDDNSSGGGRGGGGKDTINVFLYQKPAGVFDPIAPASGPDQQVISLIYEPLLNTSPEGKLVPTLAASAPKVSADGKTTTFTLRSGVTWSDGKPVTAQDVVFTYTRAADLNTGTGFAANFIGIQGLKDFQDGKAATISGITAPDDHTVSITTDEPDAGLAGMVGTVQIIPEHALKGLPVKGFATNAWWQKPAVTEGPFNFDTYKTDQYVHVTANPKFREPVGAKDVYLKPVTADVATQQLSTGEMDIATISATDADAVSKFSGVKVVSAKSFGFTRATWNQSEDRFKDPRVRQAFLYAVDRSSLVKSALGGKGEVRNSVLDPIWSGSDLQDYAYDPTKAKQLLKDAGWDSSKPVEIAWIPQSNPDRDAAATVLQDQLKAVGVTVKLKQVEASFFTDAYANRDYDMVIYGGGDYASEPSRVGPITGCDTWVPDGANVGYYCDKQLDSVLAQANATVDPTARAALYQQAAKIENADPSQMWLYAPDTVYGVSSKVRGFQATNPANFFEPWKWTKSS